jgi:competence protein ComEC
MIRTCLFLLAGIYALQLSSFAATSDLLIIALIGLIACSSRHSLQATTVVVAGVALFAIAAFAIVDSRLATRFAGDSMLTQIRIVDFPGMTGSMTVNFVAEPIDDERVPDRIRVSWVEPPVKLRLGDIWQLEVRLKRPRGNSNPGIFDYEAWMFRERFGAAGYVVPGKRNRLIGSGKLNIQERVRQQFVSRITRLVPDRDAAAVLAAIAVGTKHLISPQQWERYARTGTSHLMAISGLHIGLAAGVVYIVAMAVSGLAACRGNRHNVALLLSLIAAACYAYISGFDIPARRAALMITLMTIAVLRRREINGLLILCAACVFIVILDPVATMAPGFKLSFAAVLALVWLAKRRIAQGQGLPLWYRTVLAVRSLARLQILLLFGLMPLTVLIFDRIAFGAPAVNLIAVPLFSVFTVPLTLAALVLTGPLQFLGDQALLAAAASVELLHGVIRSAASVDAASLPVATISGFTWLVVVMPLLLVLLPPGWPGRYIAWVALLPLLMHRPTGPTEGCVDIDVLDVGQGLAAVMRTGSHVAVFDTGPSFRHGSSMGERVVLPYLTGLGIDRVDRLIVSHADLDHAGGLADVMESLVVADLLAGEPVQAQSTMSRPCMAGQTWRWDGIEFRIIHPVGGQPVEGNDASCVLQVKAGVFSLILTGDIEQAVEHRLVRDSAVSHADVVVVPHHGSGTSSTSPFVRALSPSLAVVSAGFGNQWGFPKEEVVARWEFVGAKVLTTATSGAISLRICSQSGVSNLVEHRLSERRIFHEL